MPDSDLQKSPNLGFIPGLADIKTGTIFSLLPHTSH